MALCDHCGRELADGVKFCFECGKQVGDPFRGTHRAVFSGEVHKCPQCGEVLNAYEGVCSTCGYELRGSGVSDSVQKFAEQLKTATTEYQKATIIQGFPIPNNREDIFEFLILATSNIDRHLNKAVQAAWVSKIEQSYRKAKLVLRQEQDLEQVEEIYAQAQEKLQDLTYERIKNKKMPSLPQQPKKKQCFRWTPMATIGMVMVLVTILASLMIILKDVDRNTTPSTTVTTGIPEQPDDQSEAGNLLQIDQGKEYTFGADTSDLYVARAVSDSVIKVEKWKRNVILQREYALKYEVGAYLINDPASGFRWLDEQHSTFVLTVRDQQDRSYRKGKQVTFTESWSNGNQSGGSHCPDDVFYYLHQHDERHQYKAVFVSDSLLKIECWYRPLPAGAFFYGYDVCIIDLNVETASVEWSDEDLSSFTMNLCDPQNNHLKEPAFVVFEGKN